MRRRRTGSEELRCSRCIWWRFCHCHRTRDRSREAPGARCGARRLQQRPGGTLLHPGGHPHTRGDTPTPGASNAARTRADAPARTRGGGTQRGCRVSVPRHPPRFSAGGERGAIAAQPGRGEEGENGQALQRISPAHTHASLILRLCSSLGSSRSRRSLGRRGPALPGCSRPRSPPLRPAGLGREPGPDPGRRWVLGLPRPAPVPPEKAPPDPLQTPRDPRAGAAAAPPALPAPPGFRARSRPSRAPLGCRAPAFIPAEPWLSLTQTQRNQRLFSSFFFFSPLSFPSGTASCKWGDKSRKRHAPWRRETGRAAGRGSSCSGGRRMEHLERHEGSRSGGAPRHGPTWNSRRMLATIMDTELPDAPITPTTFSGLTKTGGSPLVHLTSEVSFWMSAWTKVRDCSSA